MPNGLLIFFRTGKVLTWLRSGIGLAFLHLLIFIKKACIVYKLPFLIPDYFSIFRICQEYLVLVFFCYWTTIRAIQSCFFFFHNVSHKDFDYCFKILLIRKKVQDIYIKSHNLFNNYIFESFYSCSCCNKISLEFGYQLH